MANFKTPEMENGRVKQELKEREKRTPVSTKSVCDLKLMKQYSVECDSGVNSAGGVRKSQPSMGLKAYTMKSRKNLNEPNEVRSAERLNTYKSMIESGKRVKFEDEPVQCDAVYDCLQNFHSNEIYYQIQTNQRTEDVTMEEVNQSDRPAAGLVPFLDTIENRCAPNPILSSTSVSMRSESMQSYKSRPSTSPIFPMAKITPFKSTASLASNESDASSTSSTSTSSLSTLLKCDQVLKISKHNEIFSTYV